MNRNIFNSWLLFQANNFYSISSRTNLIFLYNKKIMHQKEVDSHSRHWSIAFLLSFSFFFFFKKDFIYLFLEKGMEGEREGEKHQCVVASCAPPTGDLAHTPGMCPDWELNQWPFGSHTSTQSTKLHQPG